jgi:hypothetical protein
MCEAPSEEFGRRLRIRGDRPGMAGVEVRVRSAAALFAAVKDYLTGTEGSASLHDVAILAVEGAAREDAYLDAGRERWRVAGGVRVQEDGDRQDADCGRAWEKAGRIEAF